MKDHQSHHQPDYNLFYLDIETLICDNIKNRVKELLRENRYAGHSPSSSDIWTDYESTTSLRDQSHSQLQVTQQQFDLTTANSRSDLSLNEEKESEFENDVATLTRVKGYLNEFANFITGYWIQTLIADEIISQTNESIDHNVFLINLIPNRISHFKRCLYLNQTPNFYHTPFDFYAINLINEESTKKDLDILDGASFQNEVNSMFIKYFRSINKLTHIKTHPLISVKSQELKIKLLTDGGGDNVAISVTNKQQLNELVKNHDRSQILNINIDKFVPSTATTTSVTESTNDCNARHEQSKSSLFFVINNKIELEDVVIDVDGCSITQNLRYFVKDLKDVCKDLRVPVTTMTTATSATQVDAIG